MFIFSEMIVCISIVSEMEEERRKEEKRKDSRSTSEETGRGEK